MLIGKLVKQKWCKCNTPIKIELTKSLHRAPSIPLQMGMGKNGK